MRIKLCNIKTGKVKSEKGFTFLELIFVMVVTGVLSSTLILPFTSGIKQGTRPEIYATATYLAEKEIEELKNGGYTLIAASHMGDGQNDVVLNGRTYTVAPTREYVRHSGGNFVDPDPLFPITEFIKVTETVSNDENSDVVSFWTILAKDFYDPVVNPP